MKAAANESFGYNEDEIVSSDIVGMRFGSLFDATQTMVNQVSDDLYEVQVVSWYDNENSYTSQMVRTIQVLLRVSLILVPTRTVYSQDYSRGAVLIEPRLFFKAWLFLLNICEL